jgi:hypothetical protein
MFYFVPPATLLSRFPSTAMPSIDWKTGATFVNAGDTIPHSFALDEACPTIINSRHKDGITQMLLMFDFIGLGICSVAVMPELTEQTIQVKLKS